MKTAQEFMKEEQRDAIADKLENFEVWMLSLHRYARRDKGRSKISYDFKQMTQFMNNYYKKSMVSLMNDNEMFKSLST